MKSMKKLFQFRKIQEKKKIVELYNDFEMEDEE
jgi:hypothetical protein